MIKLLRNIARNWFGDHEINDMCAINKRYFVRVSEVPVHLTQRSMGRQIDNINDVLNTLSAASAEQDLVRQAVALVDIVVIAKSTAVSMGLPWDQLWDDSIRCIASAKPEGYRHKRFSAVLQLHGYDRADFTAAGGPRISERLCVDRVDIPGQEVQDVQDGE